MDKGEFVKQAIEITPTMNGSYIVRRQRGLYEGLPTGDMIAFSNYRDLLKFLNEDYAMANCEAEAPDPMYPGTWA